MRRLPLIGKMLLIINLSITFNDPVVISLNIGVFYGFFETLLLHHLFMQSVLILQKWVQITLHMFPRR